MPASFHETISSPVLPAAGDTLSLPLHVSRQQQLRARENSLELEQFNHSPTSPTDERGRLLDDSHDLAPPDQFRPSTASSIDSAASITSNQKSKRSKNKTKNQLSLGRSSSSDSARETETNGHTTGAMANLIEHRRKHSTVEAPSSPAAHLMSRDNFSLDEPVPPMSPSGGGPSRGFFELSLKDRKNFLLLVLLYFLQGVPMGLASGSVPFLLKSHLSYGQIGVFTLASYPYSLKLLWSPIVDAVWSKKVGRRKSWILPIQTLSGFGMLWLGGRVEKMMVEAGENGGAGVWGFTWWWFFLVLMCATQDIAVDGKCSLPSHDPYTHHIQVGLLP